MPFATPADVQALAPNLNQGKAFSESTRPTETQVAGMIADTERLMNATVRHMGYDVDALLAATDSEAFLILRDVSAHGALARVLRSRSFGIGESSTPGAGEAQTFFDNWLKRLGDSRDPLELPNAPRTAEAVVKASADMVSSHAQGLPDAAINVDPVATMGQVF